MEESKEVFKCFEGKKVLIKTNSGFTYHTNKLNVLPGSIKFIDKFGCTYFILNSEIQLVAEEKNGT